AAGAQGRVPDWPGCRPERRGPRRVHAVLWAADLQLQDDRDIGDANRGDAGVRDGPAAGAGGADGAGSVDGDGGGGEAGAAGRGGGWGLRGGGGGEQVGR